MMLNSHGVESTGGAPGRRKLTKFSVTTRCCFSPETPGTECFFMECS